MGFRWGPQVMLQRKNGNQINCPPGLVCSTKAAGLQRILSVLPNQANYVPRFLDYLLTCIGADTSAGVVYVCSIDGWLVDDGDLHTCID